jgi:hypothetical protein
VDGLGWRMGSSSSKLDGYDHFNPPEETRKAIYAQLPDAEQRAAAVEAERRRRERLARASAGRWGHLSASAAFQCWVSFYKARRHARWLAECKRVSVDGACELIVSCMAM